MLRSRNGRNHRRVADYGPPPLTLVLLPGSQSSLPPLFPLTPPPPPAPCSTRPRPPMFPKASCDLPSVCTGAFTRNVFISLRAASRSLPAAPLPEPSSSVGCPPPLQLSCYSALCVCVFGAVWPDCLGMRPAVCLLVLISPQHSASLVTESNGSLLS